MTFYGKNKKGVKDTVFDAAKARLGFPVFQTGGVLRNLLEVVSELFYSLKTEDMEGLLDQVDYTKATGASLRQLALRYGIAPRSASKAKGLLKATAKRAGTLAQGSWLNLESDANLRFKTTKDVSYSVTGTHDIPVEAEFSGSKYNVITGSKFRFSSVNLDLALQPVSASFPETAGTDDETDAMLRRRVAARFTASFAVDLQKSRYEDAIYSNFKDVEQAKVVRTPRGAGSVDIYIKTKAGLPGKTLLAQIVKKLKRYQLIARDLQVLAPTKKSVAIRASVTTAANVKPVREAFQKLAGGLLIGENLNVQALYNAVSGFSGVEISQPTANVAASEHELIDLNSISVQAI